MVFSLKKFHDIRIDNDLSQKKMSSLLNISEDTYGNYENGRSAMPIYVAVRFANYFNLNLDYLLNIADKKSLNYYKDFDEKECAKRILKVRKEKGMSQEQLASMLNIPQRTYSSYEHNDRAIPLEFIFNLSIIFNISIDYLTGRN